MSDELLFNTHDIFSVIQGQTQAVKKRVQSIAPNRLNVPVIKDEGRI